ncbi:MAG: hypothetical protein II889_11555 [Clostridia bacterium]|nr:hypothetical protein [Clostridia bacterium]
MSSFLLKLIAAASMLLDHTGILFFPGRDIFRILGRLAFPLFAFCIAEGFRYTRSRWKYFLRIFVLGTLCQIVYTIAERDFYLGILITFSLSIALMAALDCVKTALRGEKSALAKGLERLLGCEIGETADRALTTAVFVAGCFGVFWLTTAVKVDYGFFGVMLPVTCSLFEERAQRLVMFTACLLCLAVSETGWPIQYWSLLAVPLLILYNGKPGKVRMKYFFYIFYPLHLVILYGISMLR